jgi:hypothetical protein
LLTRMARSACALTACEPVAEPTWGELTVACSPLRGTDGLCASGRSAGLPGRRDARPGLGRTRGPAHRAGPRDHLLTGEGSAARLAHQRELSDAAAEGRGTVRPVSKGPDSAARGPPTRGDSEARSIQKFSHAPEAEAAWAASDSRDKARTAPVSLGPKTGQLRPEPPRRPTRCVPLHFFLS